MHCIGSFSIGVSADVDRLEVWLLRLLRNKFFEVRTNWETNSVSNVSLLNCPFSFTDRRRDDDRRRDRRSDDDRKSGKEKVRIESVLNF